VLGTTRDYFKHFKYGKKQTLSFTQGSEFVAVYDVVLGSQVAASLNYQLGDPIVISHGISDTSFTAHDELQPDSITAFIVGLKSRMTTFRLQREINEMEREPLMAILPGVALSELWRMMSMLESTLALISSMVFVAAVLGLAAVMASSIRERKSEIHLLRIIGAPPRFLFILFQIEALLISITSVLAGSALLSLSLAIAQKQISTQLGLHLSTNLFTVNSAIIAISIIVTTVLVASFPAFQAYKQAKSVR